jgi:hypothetical protein
MLSPGLNHNDRSGNDGHLWLSPGAQPIGLAAAAQLPGHSSVRGIVPDRGNRGPDDRAVAQFAVALHASRDRF